MDYHWFRWTLRWNRRLKKKRFLVEFIMMPGGDVCTCCSLSLNQPIRARESRFVAENQWSDWPLQIQLPNRVIDTEYSNIRPRIFDLVLSNPNQSLWTFVEPESRFWRSNIRFADHWLHSKSEIIETNSPIILTGWQWYIPPWRSGFRSVCWYWKVKE